MMVIAHLIGITFFCALAASGYILTVQTMYWIICAGLFCFAFGNHINATEAIRDLNQKKQIDKHIEMLIPHFRESNFDIKCINTLFSHVMHATIAIKLLHAPILATIIIVAALASIITLRKLKEMMKHVEDDPRYKQ